MINMKKFTSGAVLPRQTETETEREIGVLDIVAFLKVTICIPSLSIASVCLCPLGDIGE